MTGNNLHERDLATWLAATAAPHVPDGTEDMIRQIVGEPQRPRWTFVGRWLPPGVSGLGSVVPHHRSLRTITVLMLLMLLLLVSLSLYAGSRPRVPAPYGPASNGIVAFEEGGEIYTIDPAGGPARPVVTGPARDHSPRWSLDGTRLAFVRNEPALARLVIVDADGTDPVISEQTFIALDTDSIAWSPDGRTVAVVADGPTARTIFLVNAVDGGVRAVDGAAPDPEAYWRHDGLAILFFAEGRPYQVSLADGSVERVPAPSGASRPFGWTPDGRCIIYHTYDAESGTILVDVETGEELVFDLGYGRVSNDGMRIAGLDPRDARWLCVAPITGGSCTRIGEVSQAYPYEAGQDLEWSPDDRWLISRPQIGPPPVLVDPGGAPVEQPAWLLAGAESWQRLP